MTSPGSDVDPVLRLVAVSDQPLDPALFEAAVNHPRAGARVVFCGVVREHDHGREVTGLEYQSHPTAEDVLREIAGEFAADPDVLALAVSHRVGVLGIGDVALVAAVATAHRQAAFEVCARLVDEVKGRLPIWKRQAFTDGSDEWVNYP
jgi:molybdopterin synthase catalytic subunit